MEYSDLVRARMVRRMVGPSAVSAMALWRETGIPQSTLSRWLRSAANIGVVSTKPDAPDQVEPPAADARRPQDWSPEERMRFVLDVHGFADHELGETLRRRGVHREQLDAWRAALAEAFAASRPARRSPEGKRIRELEREVARKDKALAETAALLVLQKKVQLLFPDGVYAGDDTDEENDK